MDGRDMGALVPACFDAILLDAPCSCEGNIRKEWRWDLDDSYVEVGKRYDVDYPLVCKMAVVSPVFLCWFMNRFFLVHGSFWWGLKYFTGILQREKKGVPLVTTMIMLLFASDFLFSIPGGMPFFLSVGNVGFTNERNLLLCFVEQPHQGGQRIHWWLAEELGVVLMHVAVFILFCVKISTWLLTFLVLVSMQNGFQRAEDKNFSFSKRQDLHYCDMLCSIWKSNHVFAKKLPSKPPVLLGIYRTINYPSFPYHVIHGRFWSRRNSWKAPGLLCGQEEIQKWTSL